jgi:hypothetical protein
MSFETCPTCGNRVASLKRHFCMGENKGAHPREDMKAGGMQSPRPIQKVERPMCPAPPSPIQAKRGRPLKRDKDKTLEATKPWEAEGMARSTWFGQRAKEKAAKQ